MEMCIFRNSSAAIRNARAAPAKVNMELQGNRGLQWMDLTGKTIGGHSDLPAVSYQLLYIWYYYVHKCWYYYQLHFYPIHVL